jgi:hypothetical protein
VCAHEGIKWQNDPLNCIERCELCELFNNQWCVLIRFPLNVAIRRSKSFYECINSWTFFDLPLFIFIFIHIYELHGIHSMSENIKFYFIMCIHSPSFPAAAAAVACMENCFNALEWQKRKIIKLSVRWWERERELEWHMQKWHILTV